MPYDTHGGGHRGESRLYCPRTEVNFSEMTREAKRPAAQHGIFEVVVVSDRAREMRKLEKVLYCRTINVVQKSQFQP